MSFSAESSHRVGFGSAKRGQQRCKETDHREDEGNTAEDQRIVGGCAEKKRLHQASYAGGGKQTDDEPERRQPRALSDNQPQDILDLRAECVTNAEFPGPLRDAVSDEPIETDRREEQGEQREQAK